MISLWECCWLVTHLDHQFRGELVSRILGVLTVLSEVSLLEWILVVLWPDEGIKTPQARDTHRRQ